MQPWLRINAAFICEHAPIRNVIFRFLGLLLADVGSLTKIGQALTGERPHLSSFSEAKHCAAHHMLSFSSLR